MFGFEFDAAARGRSVDGAGADGVVNGHYVPIIRVADSVEACLCGDPVFYDLHFAGRTLLCVGDGCEICAVQKARTMGYFPGLCRIGKVQMALLEVPYGTCVELRAKARQESGWGQHGWMGMVIRLSRVRRCVRSSLVGEVVEWRDMTRRVASADVERALFRVLGVPSVDSFANVSAWRADVAPSLLNKFRSYRAATGPQARVS